jgi:beta-glucuronidase
MQIAVNNSIIRTVKQLSRGMLLLTLVSGMWVSQPAGAQSAMINVEGRTGFSLNGQWDAIIDPTHIGEWRQVWREPIPERKTDFFEYSFDGGPALDVPGDFNTQMPELTYLEGTVWYRKRFSYELKENRRTFVHFGAVNYIAQVYLNGEYLGSHEGGFTPFQFELSDHLVSGVNTLVVGANNERRVDGLPGRGFDWFNYGGITRDVTFIETADSYIEDYFIQLRKGSMNEIAGWVLIDGPDAGQDVTVSIPEIDVVYRTRTNDRGFGEMVFTADFELWNPGNPKLYDVFIQTDTDTITDRIGFRAIAVDGPDILLNGKKIFLRGVNIHEEAPLRGARAFSEADAMMLLTWAKELGANLVRLSHYPHNEHMVKIAERMGLLVWSELPVYQHIDFAAPGMQEKLDLMLREMIRRDRNRAAVIIWCLSNETYHFTPGRDEAHMKMLDLARSLDDTRLITTVINTQGYENHTFNVWDPLYRHMDFIALNQYLGWYIPWQGLPGETQWKLVDDTKPVVISEFGGEALYGSAYGPTDEAAWWTDEYLEQIYKDQVEMFSTVPNLAGVIPWLLVDYRSTGRLHPVFQSGWNRKGLLSDRGERKKAWYIMREYFERVMHE